MSHKQVIFVRRTSKITVTSRCITFRSSSNITPSSPPYLVVITRKEVPEERSNEELPAGIGDAVDDD